MMKNARSLVHSLAVVSTLTLSSSAFAADAAPSSEDAIMATRDAAKALAKKGNLTAALGECRKLATPYAAVCSAEVYTKPRRAAQADDELARVALPESAPTRLRAWSKLVEGKTRGLALDNEQAALLFREASALAPQWCEPYAAKGDVSTGEAAAIAYRRALELCAGDRDTALSLARVLPAGAERLAVAKKLRAENVAAKAAPDADVLSMIAESAWLTGAQEDALEAAHSTLALRAGDRNATLVLAESALRDKNAGEAAELARALVKRDPNDRAAHLALAGALALADKLDAAADAYRTAFALDAKDVSPLLAASRMFLDHGKLTSARAYALKATEDVRASKDAWKQLGDVYQADKMPAAASAAYARAK